MKRSREYLILGILIVALSVYLVVRGRDRTHYKLPVLSPVPVGQIADIRIQGPAGRVELKKSGTHWRLLPGDFPADTQTVDKLLQAIGGLKLTALVARSESYGRYDLDEKQRIRVEARTADGRVLRKFEVGKVAPSFGHTFVRIDDDARVFHAPGNLRELFGKKLEDFRDKLVLRFDRGAIREIRVVREGHTTVFRRSAGSNKAGGAESATASPPAGKTPVWRTDGTGTPDGARIERFLATLDKLRCDGYLRGQKKSQFVKPVFEVLLKDDRERYRLTIYGAIDDAKEKFPGVSSQNDYVFYLDKWQAEKLMQAPAELMKKEKNKKESIPENGGTHGRKSLAPGG